MIESDREQIIEAKEEKVAVKEEKVAVKEEKIAVKEAKSDKREWRITGSTKVLVWLVIVLIVISAGGVARSFVVQDSTDKATAASKESTIASNNATEASNNATEAANSLEITAEEARDASLNTLTALEAALAEAQQQQEGLNAEFIVQALQSIGRIEAFICNGPCPDVEAPEAPG